MCGKIVSNDFTFTNITDVVVVNIICKMKRNKALGVDKLSNKLLKTGVSTISQSLCYVFNLILNAVIFPKVTPICKTSDRKLTVVIIDQSR